MGKVNSSQREASGISKKVLEQAVLYPGGGEKNQ